MSPLALALLCCALGACAGQAPLLGGEFQDPIRTEDPPPTAPSPQVQDPRAEPEPEQESAEAELAEPEPLQPTTKIGTGRTVGRATPRRGAGGSSSRPWKLIRMEHVDVLREHQFESAFTLEVNDESTAFGVVLDYGVTDRMTVHGKVAAGDQADSLWLGEEPGNLFEVGGQYGFLTEPDRFRMSGRLDIVLSDEMSFEVPRTPREDSRKVNFQPSLLFGAPMGETVELFGEVGGRIGESTDPAFVAATAIAINVNRVTFLAEIDGSFQDDADEVYFAPGVVFNPREKIQLRVGVPIGLTNESLDWRLMATLGVRF